MPEQPRPRDYLQRLGYTHKVFREARDAANKSKNPAKPPMSDSYKAAKDAAEKNLRDSVANHPTQDTAEKGPFNENKKSKGTPTGKQAARAQFYKDLAERKAAKEASKTTTKGYVGGGGSPVRPGAEVGRVAVGAAAPSRSLATKVFRVGLHGTAAVTSFLAVERVTNRLSNGEDPIEVAIQEGIPFLGSVVGGAAGGYLTKRPEGVVAGAIAGGTLGNVAADWLTELLRAKGILKNVSKLGTQKEATTEYPFRGGQCETNYTVEGTVSYTTIGGSNVSSTFKYDLITGPIRGIIKGQVGGPYPFVNYWYTIGQRTGLATPLITSPPERSNSWEPRDSTVSIKITSVTRNDGQPDNCGDPAPVPVHIPSYTDKTTDGSKTLEQSPEKPPGSISTPTPKDLLFPSKPETPTKIKVKEGEPITIRPGDGQPITITPTEDGEVIVPQTTPGSTDTPVIIKYPNKQPIRLVAPGTGPVTINIPGYKPITIDPTGQRSPSTEGLKNPTLDPETKLTPDLFVPNIFYPTPDPKTTSTPETEKPPDKQTVKEGVCETVQPGGCVDNAAQGWMDDLIDLIKDFVKGLLEDLLTAIKDFLIGQFKDLLEDLFSDDEDEEESEAAIDYDRIRQIVREEVAAKVDPLSNAVGVSEYPVSLPPSLISTGAAAGANVSLANMTQLWGWYIQRFDEIVGQFEIPIEIKDTDPTTAGDQPTRIKLPNIAESIAEMFVLLFQVSIDAQTLVNISTRTMLEGGQDKQQNYMTYRLIQSLVDWTGFKVKEEAADLPLLFTPGKTSFEELLQETKVKVNVVEFDEKHGLEADLMRFRKAASILDAVHYKKVNPFGDIKTQLMDELKKKLKLADEINGNDDDAFEKFIDEVQEGFAKQPGIDEPTKPYGRDYDQRPKIRDLTKYKPPTEE